jgi:hypothetical protein
MLRHAEVQHTAAQAQSIACACNADTHTSIFSTSSDVLVHPLAHLSALLVLQLLQRDALNLPDLFVRCPVKAAPYMQTDCHARMAALTVTSLAACAWSTPKC